MLKELEGGDWSEAFKYASSENISPTVGDPSCPKDSFDRESVTEIIGLREGENDSDSWLLVGKLEDGRFFLLEAWCDYTGWS